MLGMSAALASGEHKATAEALEPCRVRVLQLKHLRTMLQIYGDASSGAANALAEDYRAAFEHAPTDGTLYIAGGQVAHLLLDWADHAKGRSNWLITMSLTHEEIAPMPRSCSTVPPIAFLHCPLNDSLAHDHRTLRFDVKLLEIYGPPRHCREKRRAIDRSAQMYLAFRWRSSLLAMTSCAACSI